MVSETVTVICAVSEKRLLCRDLDDMIYFSLRTDRTLNLVHLSCRKKRTSTSGIWEKRPQSMTNCRSMDRILHFWWSELTLVLHVQDQFGVELVSLIENASEVTIEKLAHEVQRLLGSQPHQGEQHAVSQTRAMASFICHAPITVKMRLFCLPYAGGVSANVFGRYAGSIAIPFSSWLDPFLCHNWILWHCRCHKVLMSSAWSTSIPP